MYGAQCVAMGGSVDVWGSVCSYGWLCVSDVLLYVANSQVS